MDFKQHLEMAKDKRARVRESNRVRAILTWPQGIAEGPLAIDKPVFDSNHLVDDTWFHASQKGRAQYVNLYGYDSPAQFPFQQDEIYFEHKYAWEPEDHYVSMGAARHEAGPVSFPLILEMPAEYMRAEGEFDFRFRVVSYNGVESSSLPTTLIQDWSAPVPAPQTPSKVIYPFDPQEFLLTTEALEALPSEGLAVRIPKYDDRAATDKIQWAWMSGMPGAPEVPANSPVEPLPDDLIVYVPAALIRQSDDRDGRAYFAYRLLDPAGNQSLISAVEPVKISLGVAPGPVQPPNVPLAQPYLEYADLQEAVYVEIPLLLNFYYSDMIVVTWGSRALGAVQIGAQDPSPIQIRVPVSVLKAEYPLGANGLVNVPVSYEVFRGYNSWPSATVQVPVDFSTAGPENPDWPAPVNPALARPVLTPFEGAANEIIGAPNIGQDATVRIQLFSEAQVTDQIQLYWNSEPTGAPYSVGEGDIPGADIEFALGWDAIAAAGDGPAIALAYGIRTVDGINEINSPPASVRVEVIPVSLDAPVFPQMAAHPDGYINCNIANMDHGRLHVGIPGHAGYVEQGAEITVYWEGYRSSADGMAPGEPVPQTNWTGTLTWSPALNTVYIEPGEVHLYVHPEPDDVGFGFCKCYYTVAVGDRVVRSAENIKRVSMGTPSGLCEIVPRP